MADNSLSFNISAPDEASQTFVDLADRVEKLAVKLDELGAKSAKPGIDLQDAKARADLVGLVALLDEVDRKKATPKVDVDTKNADASLNAFSGRWAAIAAGIAAGSPAIGAALLAGVGAGFVGLAVLAQKNNQAVKDSFSQLKLDVVSEMKGASDQVVPYLTAAASSLDSELAQLGPQLHQAFAPAGPDLAVITTGLDHLSHNAMPGLVSVMREGQPVVAGTASLLGDLGTTAGDTFTSMSQHSRDYGQVMTSLGPLTHDAVGAVIGVVNDLAAVWAKNGTQIDATITHLGNDIVGLANGATHMLSAGFGGMLGTVNLLLSGLRPIAPALGAIGGAVLPVVGSFRLFSALGSPIESLGTGIGNLGSKMKDADGIAGRLAGSVSGAGTAVSKFGGALPYLGAAITAAIALEQSFGTTSDQLAQDLLQGGTQAEFAAKHIGGMAPLLSATLSQLSGTQKAQALYNYDVAQFGPKSQQAANALKIYGLESQKAAAEQKALADAAAAGVSMLPAVAAASSQAATAVTMFGGSLDTATQDARAFAAANPAATIGDIFNAAVQAAVKVPNALQSVADHFKETQTAVASASQSLEDAQHSYAQSSEGVAVANDQLVKSEQAVRDAAQGVVDADHQVIQAKWAVTSAEQGVQTAEQHLTKAQQDSRQAQVDLTQARRDAAQQLADMHLQLVDQTNAEESARLQLEQARANQLGVAVTTLDPNYDTRSKALAVADAQAHLNDTMSQGAQLRNQVAEADTKGVEGSALVVAAQQKVQQTAQAVVSAESALVTAHQSVTTANWGLQKAYEGVQKAQQAVLDAKDAEVRAHQAVETALYSRQRAADAVTRAQQAMSDATARNSTTLDINSAAGRTNLTMLGTAVQAILDSHEPLSNQFTDLFNIGQQFFHNTDLTSGWITKLLGIPPQVQFSIKGVAQLDMIQLEQSLYPGATPQSLAADLARLDPKNPNYVPSAVLHAAGGPVEGHSPSPTADNIPAWLTAGEYVHPVSSVDYYGPSVMDALRQRRIPREAIAGFASGGLAGTSAAANNRSLLLGGYYGGIGAGYETGGRLLSVFGFPFKSIADVAPVLPDSAFAGLRAMLGGASSGGGVGGQIAYAAGAGVAQWAPLILQALAALGQPASWLGTVERRMNQESGGNPNSINNWDSNAARGDPSRGLMQTIGSTFNAYKPPGATNIYDPYSNIYAGLNYALHRYGSLSALNRPGGYDSGGWLKPGETGVNHLRKPEAVLTPEESEAFKQLAASAASGTTAQAPNVTVNVYAQTNASASDIAHEAVRHLTFAMR